MSVQPFVELQFAHRSDRGYARRVNEDTSAIEEVYLPDGCCVVLGAVADGIGGARAGAEASRIAVSAAFNHFHDGLRRHVPQKGQQWQQLLVAALRAANSAVMARSCAGDRRGMGTTLMLTAVVGRRAHIAHIGDCRAYAVRPAMRRPQITQL